jgi:ribosomal protein L20A (L18A)
MQKEYQAIPGYHPITLVLIEQLKKGKVGDVLTEEKIKEITGASVGVDQDDYGKLMSAMRHCVKSGVVWQRIRGSRCIKCLNASEILDSSQSDISAIRRRARRSTLKIQTVDVAKVPEIERPSFFRTSAQLGAMAMFASKSSGEKLLEITKPQSLSLSDIAAVFQK